MVIRIFASSMAISTSPSPFAAGAWYCALSDRSSPAVFRFVRE